MACGGTTKDVDQLTEQSREVFDTFTLLSDEYDAWGRTPIGGYIISTSNSFAAVREFVDNHDENWSTLRSMYGQWAMFTALVDNAELALAKADMQIAKSYAARSSPIAPCILPSTGAIPLVLSLGNFVLSKPKTVLLANGVKLEKAGFRNLLILLHFRSTGCIRPR